MNRNFTLCLLFVVTSFSFKANAQVQLQSPELAMSVIATDSIRAKEFYVNCLGLNHNNTLTITGMKMFLFGCGQATVKVRVYTTDPPAQDPNLTAANGFRFLTIPVNNFDTVVARLNAYGFPPPLVRNESGVRTAMSKDGDGNVVEILDAATTPGRKLEIGLLSSTADSLDLLYQNILGFPVAPAVTGPAPVDSATEYRFSANNTIIRIFERPGNRPSDHYTIGGVQGYRYITFTLLADIDLLYQTMIDSGIVIATSLASYGSSYYLFIVRGPGGALHEFVGPLHVFTNTAFTDMEFFADYYAPGMPASDPLAQTLEANALVIHNGKIYCSTTYGGPSGVPSTADPKILVKDSADGNWKIDYHGTNKFVRFPIIRSVNFTSDASGNDLPQPVSVLVAGAGAWRSWNPDGVYVISRNDNTGQWVESKLSDQCWNIADANHGCEVRAVFDHRDKVTGVHYVFAGSYSGALFRGWYNPAMPGLIEWDPNPEIDSLLGHALCSATINDTLYMGMSFGEASGVPNVWRPFKDYGIWKRIDGVRLPVHGHNYNHADDLQWRWIEIPEWEDTLNPGEHIRMGQFRGMTAIPDPNGGNHKVLAFHWDSPDNLIEMVDPSNGYQSSVEFSPKAYLQSQWGNSAQSLTLGYNEWTPAVHPVSNDSVHFIGAWATYPGGETGSSEGRSSWFFVRYSDATYNIIRIRDTNNTYLNTASNGLKGCRSIIPSPFPEEAGYVWYFCGFDLTGSGTTSVTGNKAWIYKGFLPNMPTGMEKPVALASPVIYPNPSSDKLFVTNLPAAFTGNVKVYNAFGQTVLDEQKSGSGFMIETARWQNGIYFIHIKDEKGKLFTTKFIKE